MKANAICPIDASEAPLHLLERCDGYYECVGDGPLVGYAGRYGPENKQYVGGVYANFAKLEAHGPALQHVVKQIVELYGSKLLEGDCFCGAPEGGKALAVALAVGFGKDYIFPEKEVTALKTESSRERSRLVWARHEPTAGAGVWIVEDVCNNFSTTADMVELIEGKGAHVLGVVCFLNRSMTVDKAFSPAPGRELPVFALVRKPYAEFMQDDPAVADKVKAGNVVWKPKNEWRKLVRPEKTETD